jgi:hypothetical protein
VLPEQLVLVNGPLHVSHNEHISNLDLTVVVISRLEVSGFVVCEMLVMLLHVAYDSAVGMV